MQIVWLRAALNNLDAVAEYIAMENPAAAANVVSKILQQIEQLKDQPALGRPGRVMGTRELVISDTHYLVPYRIQNNQVQILRVFHTSQQPPKKW